MTAKNSAKKKKKSSRVTLKEAFSLGLVVEKQQSGKMSMALEVHYVNCPMNYIDHGGRVVRTPAS